MPTHADAHAGGRPPITDADDRLVVDLACTGCGYNLRTLRLDAACPECGTAVGRAVEGSRLRYCDPAWLERIWRGLGCMAGAIAIAMALCAAALVLYLPQEMSVLIIVAALTLFAIGVFHATSPDPAGIDREPALSARRLARFGLFVPLIAWVGAELANTSMLVAGRLAGRPLTGGFSFLDGSARYFGPILLTGVIAGMLAMLVHAAQLARRLPNRPLAVATMTVLIIFGGSALTLVAIEFFHTAHRLYEMMQASPWQPLSPPHYYRLYRLGLDGLGLGLMFGMVALIGLLLWFWVELRRAADHARSTWARHDDKSAD